MRPRVRIGTRARMGGQDSDSDQGPELDSGQDAAMGSDWGPDWEPGQNGEPVPERSRYANSAPELKEGYGRS